MKNVWMVLCSVILVTLLASCSGGNAAPSAPQKTVPSASIVGTWAWGNPSVL